MTDRPVIIALTSKRGRSGKDTLVEKLREAGYLVHRVAFGDVLKSTCAGELTTCQDFAVVLESYMHMDLKDAPMEELAIAKLPRGAYRHFLEKYAECDSPFHAWMTKPRSPRWHLQQYGTGFRRNHINEPDVWLKAGLREIAKAPADHVVVVTDMRQANEYHALADLGAHLVRLTRDWSIEAVDSVPLHATDTELDGYVMDALVENRWGHADDMLVQLKAQGVIEQ